MTQRNFTIVAFLLAVWLFAFATPFCAADDESRINPSRRVLSSASELGYPPFALVREDGTADGFSVDLLKAVCEAVGLEVSFRVGPWHAIKNDLANGKLDVLPLVAYSAERDAVFDFTAPYLRMHSTIFVRKGETSIRNESDLKDREVLVMRDDMAHEYAVRNKVTDRLILTDTFEEAMKRLSAGQHDAVIVQHLMGLQLIKKIGITNVVSIRSSINTSLKPAVNSRSGFEQKISIAVREGNKELLSLLNEGLALVITAGQYDELYDKWFGPILPQPAVSPATIGKYLAYILLPLLAMIGFATTWLLRREVERKTGIIKENEEKFAIVFNKSPFPVSLSTFKDGIFIDVNEAWTAAVGIDREEAIGRTTEELGLLKNPEERARIYAQLRKNGSIRRMELTGYRSRTNPSPVALADVELIEIAGETYVFACVQDITERKRGEEALKRSEERLKKAQEVAHLGSWELELESNQLVWSDEVYRIFGFQPQQFEASYGAFLASVHPEDRHKVDEAYSGSLRDNLGCYEIEHRVFRPDGEVRFVHERCEHIKDDSGRIVRSVGMVHDITERKLNEERMQREHRETEFANRVLRAFIEYEGDDLFDRALAIVQEEMASRHGVFGYIAEPGHLYCPSLSKMLDACAIEGKYIHYPPEKWKGLWARALKEKRSLYTNEAPPVPPGHPVIDNNLTTPILFQGDVIGLLNIANKDGGYTNADRDTLDRLANRIAPVLYAWVQRKLREDERNAARAEVQRLAEQRQLALDAAKLGWWQFDPNTRGAQWDEGYRAIFGVGGYDRPNDEILRQIVHPEDLPVLWAEIAAALNPEDPKLFATEYRINRPDGQMRWVEDHGIATFEGEGANRRAVNFVGTVQDITKRKLAEKALLESENRLKQSLTEKEVLLKEIHHRVKNNMQVISSLVDLQANEVPDAGMREIFQDVVHRVRSMALVHEKLYQSDDLARVDFSDYAETLLRYLWRSHGDMASGIRLDLNLEAVDLPVNQAVPCGLMLNEMVGNTLKHAFRGRSTGRVSVSLQDGEGRVRLKVSDDGVGLPDGLDWRSAPSLGLRLVQMLARQMNATVEARNEEGTVFAITFEKSTL